MNIAKFIAVPIALLLALVVVMQIFTGGGNILGSLAAYLGGAAFVIGFLSPKTALYFMVVIIAYVDVLKRMLAIDISFTLTDTAAILAIPLALMLGVCAGLASQVIMGRNKIPLGPFIMGNVLAILIGGVMLMRDGFGLRAIALAANSGAYCVLLWVVPTVFKTRRDLWKYAAWMVVVFFPVGIIGIKQLYLGYSDFEIAYLMSGVTIEIKQLFGDGIRPFATMAAPGTFSGMMSTCAILVIFLSATRKDIMGKRASVILAILLFFFFIFAGFCSMKRLPILVWVMALGGLVVMRSWWTVILTYASGIALFCYVGLNYEAVFDWLMEVNEEVVAEGEVGSKVTRLGTLNARLETIAALFEKENYSWFGIPNEELSERAILAHGIILTLLTRAGVVPLLAFGALGGYVMFRIHAAVIRAPRRTVKFRSALILSSLTLALIASTIIGGLVVTAFPMNFLCFLFLTLTLIETGIIKGSWDEVPAPVPDPGPARSPAPGMVGGRPVTRLPLGPDRGDELVQGGA